MSGAWTNDDLDRLSPQQIRALTRAGELDHLLRGEEPTQEQADYEKLRTLLEAEEG